MIVKKCYKNVVFCGVVLNKMLHGTGVNILRRRADRAEGDRKGHLCIIVEK